MKFIILKYTIFLLLILIIKTSFSQSKQEVAIKEINKIKDTVEKIEKYIEYANKNIENEEFAIKLLNNSLKLSDKKKYSKGLLETYNLFIKIFVNDTSKIQKYLLKSVLIRENNKRLFPKDTENLNQLIDLYFNIALTYENTKEINRAIDYYKKIIEIANTQQNTNLHSNALKNIGDCYLFLDEYSKAIYTYKKCLILYENLDNPEKIFEITYLLGNVYFQKGEFTNSLNYIFLALKLADNLDSINYQSYCYLYISRIYNKLQLFDKSFEYGTKGLDFAIHQNDSITISIVYNYLAEIMFSQKNYKASLNYYEKSKRILEKLNQKTWLAIVYNGFGLTLDELGKHDEAYKYLLLSLSIRKIEKRKKEIADSYINLGKHYLLIQKLQEAENYLMKGYLMAKEISNNIEIQEAAKSLAQLYMQKKEFENAFEYQTLYLTYNDSVINQQLANDIAKFELSYKYEQEKKLKDEELKSTKSFQTLLVGSLICLLFLLIIIAKNYRLRIIKDKKLQKQQKKIEAQNEIIKNKSDEYEKLALVASKSDNGVIIMDKDANIEWINESFLKKYSIDERLSKIKKGENLYKVSSKNNIKELIDECITLKRSIHYDYYNENIENPLWIQTTLTPIYENDVLIKLLAVDTDVTDIKIAENKILNQNEKLEQQADLLSLYISQLTAQKIAVQETNEELQQQHEELITQTELLELTNQELVKLSIVASKTDNSIFILTPNGTITWVNDAFKQYTGYSLEEYTFKFGKNIIESSTNSNIEADFDLCLKTKKTVIYHSKIVTKQNTEKWLQTSLTPILDDYSNIIQVVAIDTDITQIKLAEQKITEQNREITDSIQYASRIQKALLPMDIYVSAVFENYFIFNRPRDIVSGDFYWIGYRDKKVVLALADCTGHGIPGAFMSMLGLMSLNTIVYKIKNLKADEILNTFKETIINLLHQRGKDGEARDGMDVALCIFDFDNMKLQYSGANSPIYIIKKEIDTDNLPILNRYKPNKMPIGYFAAADEAFTEHIIDLDFDDLVYLSSDGYKDQFGGKEDKKYLSLNFRNFLRKIYHYPLKNQEMLLEKEIEDWKGNTAQVDDILVIGIKI